MSASRTGWSIWNRNAPASRRAHADEIFAISSRNIYQCPLWPDMDPSYNLQGQANAQPEYAGTLWGDR
jgi:hypothetical protein